ncbi:hypothetical protein T11_15575 [Trichinella zimbabwensis]|uniref:Uncharacterized protein n=1 Tax=Trichinella zimbabwensis TaxID=268475 RepID=A0A0V1HWS8_9BILA|nr:hypothetical protein T11_15575 [Trichinella zimbabwensis]
MVIFIMNFIMHLHESRQREKRVSFKMDSFLKRSSKCNDALTLQRNNKINPYKQQPIDQLLSAFRATACQQISTRFRTKSSNYYIGIKAIDSSKKLSMTRRIHFSKQQIIQHKSVKKPLKSHEIMSVFFILKEMRLILQKLDFLFLYIL